jgi:hypothetical protein
MEVEYLVRRIVNINKEMGGTLAYEIKEEED